MQEVSFDLPLLNKMLTWLLEVFTALTRRGWEKRHFQCLKEVPAAGRAALYALQNWSWDLVSPYAEQLGNSPRRMTQTEMIMVAELWADICKKNTHLSKPFIKHENLASSQYRGNYVGVKFEHTVLKKRRTLCVIIDLDLDARPDFVGRCMYDLYILVETGNPAVRMGCGCQEYESIAQLFNDIHEEIGNYEKLWG